MEYFKGFLLDIASFSPAEYLVGPLIAIPLAIFCGCYCWKTLKEKGYPDSKNNGFFLGFVFNVLGVLICKWSDEYGSKEYKGSTRRKNQRQSTQYESDNVWNNEMTRRRENERKRNQELYGRDDEPEFGDTFGYGSLHYVGTNSDGSLRLRDSDGNDVKAYRDSNGNIRRVDNDEWI